ETVDAVTQWRDLGLWKYKLEDNEWVILQQLQDILKDATLYFSRATPNLATVIPAMDHVDKTLNWYYQLTDKSHTYQIAMVLHPQHRLSYFKAAHWPDKWIQTVDQLVRREFKRSY
ncbi:hypothetical protein P692DRAFT_201677760, partial [Suillus brevipes Sb2]